MDIRRTIPFFAIWLIVLAALCIGFAYDSSTTMYSGLMWMSILVYSNKASYTSEISKRQKWAAIGFVAVFISLIIWTAVSGYGAKSNEYFHNSNYRPYIGLCFFVLYAYCGFWAFCGLRKKANMNSEPQPDETSRLTPSSKVTTRKV
jgi:energy-coupling factor transporter transmembrane protein EcfT